LTASKIHCYFLDLFRLFDRIDVIAHMQLL